LRTDLVLVPSRAALTVTVDPPRAEVLIDGVRAGQAPLNQPALTPGPHRVEVKLAGHHALARQLELRDGDTGYLSVRLERGRLHPVWFALSGSLAVGGIIGAALLNSQARASVSRFQDLQGQLARPTFSRTGLGQAKEEASALAADSDRRYVASAALFAVGGMATVGAIVIGYLTRWRPSRGEVRIHAGGDGVGVTAGGSF
jgi:hypothetical protein